MKYARLFGMLALVAAASMAFVSTASATTATDSAEGSPVEVGDVIHAVSVGNVTTHGTVTLTCKKSTFQAVVTNPGSAATTLSGHLTALTFEECGNNTISVVNKGTFEIHTDHNSPNIIDHNGTLTLTGTEITTLSHNILGTVHCIYVTEGTYLGTIDGSANRSNGTATITSESPLIPYKSTDFGCGSGFEWTAHYTITTPDYLDID